MHQAVIELGLLPESGVYSVLDIVKVAFPGTGHTLLGTGRADIGFTTISSV